MPESAWAKEETTQRLDLSGYPSEDLNQKTQEISTQLDLRKKAATQEEYQQAYREVKRNLNKDKRDYKESLTKEAEKSAYQVNMKELYMITKKLAGKYYRPERLVIDRQGQTITD
jgi:predicted nucleotidyltransferase